MLSRRAHHPTRISGILGAGLLSLLFGTPAAAQTSLFANDSEWVIDDVGGTNDGTLAGTCDTSPGFTVSDAFLGDMADAYDFGHTVWVDDVQFQASGALTVGSRTVTAGPVAMSGLDVFVQYGSMTATPTLRTLIGFVNRGGAEITVKVQHSTNVSTDAQTFFGPTSSGDNAFLGNDRWIITRRNVDPLLAPAITHVHRGVGTTDLVATALAITSFACPATQTQGITVTYDVTVPAGETRYLLFFNSLSESVSAAVGAAEIFEDPSLGSDLLFGLLPEQLLEIVNWDFSPSCRNAKKQSLTLKAKDNKMQYRWTRGEATTIADYGDPLERTSYLVCIIDFVADVPFVESCAAAPAGTLGWRTKGNGYKYRMKDGSPDGITRLKLRRGEQNRGKITALAEGMDFELPLAQDPEVRVLVVGNDTCWQARFVDEAKKNDVKQFKAKQSFKSTDAEDEEEPPPVEDPA
jgi:hypothetical protein